MSDHAPPSHRRPFPAFAVLATFIGTLCATAFGALVVIELVPRTYWDGTSSARSASRCPISHADAPPARSSRARDCQAAMRVQEVLTTSGVPAAQVSVTTTEVGPADEPRLVRAVVVQLFADDELLRAWPASDMARTVAAAAGTDVRHVIISDDRLRTLFDGASRGAPAARAPR